MLETSSLCYESPSLVFLYRLILDINRREVNWRRGMQKWAQNCQASCFFKPEFFFTDYLHYYIFSSVQFSRSVVSNSATPWTAAHQASLSITSFWSLLRLMSIESVMPSNHLIFCRPFLLLPSVFPSVRRRVSSLHQVAEVLEFQLQHQSFQ